MTSTYNKVVLTRVDINVPVEDGVVSDDAHRAHRADDRGHPRQGGKPVLLAISTGRSGQGRPEHEPRRRCRALEKALAAGGLRLQDCVGPTLRPAIAALPQGGVLLLEEYPPMPAGKERSRLRPSSRASATSLQRRLLGRASGACPDGKPSPGCCRPAPGG